jgi:hypothetical protein
MGGAARSSLTRKIMRFLVTVWSKLLTFKLINNCLPTTKRRPTFARRWHRQEPREAGAENEWSPEWSPTQPAWAGAAGIKQHHPSPKAKQINTARDSGGQNKTRFGELANRRLQPLGHLSNSYPSTT